MPSDLNLLRMNHFVLSKQRLNCEKPDENFVETVKAVGGLHATSPTTPYLSLFARVENFRREQLDAELYCKRSLGKVRYVRTTVYILHKELIPTAFAATRMMAEPASQAYAQFLGITKEQYAETSRCIKEILKGQKGMTTKQIKQELGTSLNVSSIVNLMCDQGLLIRSAPEKGWRSNMHTYCLFNEYFPDLNLNALSEKDARRAVVRQYLASFGPATESDVSWWTGFPKGQVKQMVEELQDEITSVDVSGTDKAFLVSYSDEKSLMSMRDEGKHSVSMLPTLDPYLMGYKDRERYLDLAHYDYVFDRGGNAVATILLDGKVIGVWDFEEPFVKVFLFDDAKVDVFNEILSKAKSIGAFISGQEVAIKKCDSMVPLTQRTAGGMMSPLKYS